MKTTFFILFLLLGKPSGIDYKNYLSCHVSDIPFSDFTNEVYQQTGVKIFYDENLLKEVRVTLNADSISVEEALKTVLKNTGIEVSPWQNNFVLLKGEKLISILPDYEQIVNKKDSLIQQTKGLTESEIKYLTARTVNSTETYKVGKVGLNGTHSNVIISGRILDQETGTPISNATVFIAETGKGAIANNGGYFSLVHNPGKFNARIESLGHEKKNIFLEILSEGDLNVELKKEDILIEEVMVYGDRQANLKSKEPGLERIAVKAIKEIPMMIGERDILKVSSLLPGIVSVGEGSAGLNVRGGSSDQNAFYISKVPIYNTSHLFGFFPAFNSDIIKDFSIYKGYVPAQFGGRLSSVFNITTREANNKHFTAHGGINPVTGFITLEGPIVKNSLTALFTARTCYSDWILSKVKDPTIRNSKAGFNDFSGIINYTRKKSQLTLFIYNSNDRFRLSDINEYKYSNLGGSLNLHTIFSPSLNGDFTIIGSEYTFETTDNHEVSTAYQHNYKIGHYEFQSDFNHVISDKTTLNYGANMILYNLDRGSVLPYGFNSLKAPINLGKEQGVESAIYLTDKYNIFPRLTLTLGFRQSVFTPIGPKSVYDYNDNSPREEKYIIDTLNYASNKPIKWYFSPEIRTSITFQTDRDGSIKLAFNQMQQNLFMLSNTMSVGPNTQWKLADYHIKPSRSMQVSLGIFRTFPKEGLEASVEVYAKKTSNLPEFKDGANFLGTSAVETTILQGDQKSYGIEFFIKRSGRKLNGWLSYTYSRSIVQIKGKNAWDCINEGKAYPSNYDIPHSINALINYRFNRRLSLSTVTTYQTGRPVTYPISIYYINGRQYIDYSSRNKYTIPDYFRIDASLTIEGNLKKNKKLHSSFMISVYNLTGRRNPYSVYYKSIGPQVYSYKYSVIGIPLFTVTWLFKLGNYDSN